MLPYKLNFGEYQDKDQTNEWIDSLITQENLPTILTHYDPIYYTYLRQDEDMDGMPNYNIFGFAPKDRKYLTPQRMGKIFEELFRRTLITEPMNEAQSWEFNQSTYNLTIILKATD